MVIEDGHFLVLKRLSEDLSETSEWKLALEEILSHVV